MTKLFIKYNPYIIHTDIKVNDENPRQNSSLVISDGVRLQEWVDNLPDLILKEFRDANVKITFDGTAADFEDLRVAFLAKKDVIDSQFELKERPNTSEVENKIDEIFKKIQEGPVDELRSDEIVNAFKSAKNSRFEVNVIATVSSGKSTLINSLLGKRLLPIANEATTATTVEIINSPSDSFTGKAFDKHGVLVAQSDEVTSITMNRWNSNPDIVDIQLKGRIPFVSNVGMNLVLVDTPGPNNSRNKTHEEITYSMVENSDKSLVMYVFNGEQLGINDDTELLDYICAEMGKSGKKSRQRFIFVMNKVDSFKPQENEGHKRIEPSLMNLKAILAERGVTEANIFPAAAAAALDKRVDDPYDEENLFTFRNRLKAGKEYFQLHQYYTFNNLPVSSRRKIEDKLDSLSEEDKVEIYTGIPSIEEAISIYVNKYARTTKIYDLVQSFNSILEDSAAFARIEDDIQSNKDAKAALDRSIKIIKENIRTANNAQTCTKKIDQIDLTGVVKDKLDEYLKDLNKEINSMIMEQSAHVRIDQAKKDCATLENKCKAKVAQANIKISGIFKEAFSAAYTDIIQEYKKYLSELNLSSSLGKQNFSPESILAGDIAEVSSLIKSSTTSEDEKYTKTEEYTVTIPGTRVDRAKKWALVGAGLGVAALVFSPAAPLVLAAASAAAGAATGKDERTETRTRQVEATRKVDYVNMNDVATNYLAPLQANLKMVQKKSREEVVKMTNSMKVLLHEEIDRLNKVLDNKLKRLEEMSASSNAKEEEINRKKQNLAWLESIETEVNELIRF